MVKLLGILKVSMIRKRLVKQLETANMKHGMTEQNENLYLRLNFCDSSNVKRREIAKTSIGMKLKHTLWVQRTSKIVIFAVQLSYFVHTSRLAKKHFSRYNKLHIYMSMVKSNSQRFSFSALVTKDIWNNKCASSFSDEVSFKNCWPRIIRPPSSESKTYYKVLRCPKTGYQHALSYYVHVKANLWHPTW